jgi:hypothetical protein
MIDNKATWEQVQTMLQAWQQDPMNMKQTFIDYAEWLAAQEGVRLEYKARPGVSYSLRATHANQSTRPLFVLVDIVDDEPEARWLSVCFYADMVNDPEELGDFVPQGLMGEDACCLNLDEDNNDLRAYVRARIEEAAAAAR